MSLPSRSASAAALALALFAVSWGVLHFGWFARGQIVDTPVYQKYGDAVVDGKLPYRDFNVEYPPGALPAFVLPAIGDANDEAKFRRAFETLMAACGAALLIALALALTALRAPPRRLYLSLALAGISPLLLGSVVLSRYDLWPAALVAAALAAMLSGRLRLGHVLLGAGIAAKVWPGVLLPLTVAWVWRRRGRREGLTSVALALGTVVVVALPFLVLAPHGLWRAFEQQATRPLQIESLGAALIVASHHLFGTGAQMVGSHGSQNIDGTVANVVGSLQSLVEVGVLFALWVVFARRERDEEDLVRWSAAAVVAFVALGKVLSPQFLVWLIAVVPLVRAWRVRLLYVVALVLTQAEFPQRYWPYALEFNETTSWLVLARDVVLVLLLVSLVSNRWGERSKVGARRDSTPSHLATPVSDTG